MLHLFYFILKHFEDLDKFERPLDPADERVISDLLWSDPDQAIMGWGPNDRGAGVTFGRLLKNLISSPG